MNIDKIRELSKRYAEGWNPPQPRHPARAPKPTRAGNFKKRGSEAMLRKRELKRRPTKAEVEFRKILDRLRMSYQFQKVVFTPTHYFILDFVIRMNPRLIIEIDGACHDRRKEYDEMRTRMVLQTEGYRTYRVVRFRNEQVFNGEAEQAICELYPKMARKAGKASAEKRWGKRKEGGTEVER